jgi:hypothetical protein
MTFKDFGMHSSYLLIVLALLFLKQYVSAEHLEISDRVP